MRTTASLAAFVTLMAVASSNGAPIGTPSGSSARSISRARGQVRSRNVPPMPPNFQEVDYAVDVPNVRCGDCRESEVKKVSVDATGPATDMKGDLKDMMAKFTSNDVQAPSAPSGTGSVDVDVDAGDSEGSNESSTRPEKHANDDDANAKSDDTNDGTHDGTNGNSETNDGRTDNGQAEDGGKANPPAEQPPCDSNDVAQDVRDELEADNKVAEDKASHAMAKAEGESSQAGDDAKAAFSSINEFGGEMRNKAQQMADSMPDDMGLHAEAKMNAKSQGDAGESYKMPNGDGSMPELVTVSQEPSNENPEDCKDETAVEMRKGNLSVSTSVVRR